MGRIGRVLDSVFKTRSTAPGKSVVIKTGSAGGVRRTAEMYHNPGIASRPTEGDRVIEIPIGNSGTRVIIASHNYNIKEEPLPGETIVFSTNESGDTVKAKIKIDQDGNITATNEGGAEVTIDSDGNVNINGDSKRFVTYAELDAALQSHTHGPGTYATSQGPVTGVSGSPTNLDISAAETETVKTGG